MFTFYDLNVYSEVFYVLRYLDIDFTTEVKYLGNGDFEFIILLVEND